MVNNKVVQLFLNNNTNYYYNYYWHVDVIAYVLARAGGLMVKGVPLLVPACVRCGGAEDAHLMLRLRMKIKGRPRSLGPVLL